MSDFSAGEWLCRLLKPLQTKAADQIKIIQLCFNPRVRNFPTFCEVKKILNGCEISERFRLQRRCVHTVPRVRRPSRPNVESLSGHQGEHWFAKEGFKSQMTNYFQYPHPQQPPRRNCRLLKKLFRFIIILTQIKLKLK